MLWSLVAVGLVIALAAYALLALARRLRSQRERSEERAAALTLELQRHRKAAAGPDRAGSNVLPASRPGKEETAAGPPRLPPSAGPEGLQALRRARLLTDAQRLLYLLVRTAVPDHVVLANIRAIDLLDLPAGPEPLARDPRLLALLHQRLDCVVCASDLTPLAALVVNAASAAAAASEQQAGATMRELGIRFLRFRSDSLPRPAEMRALILG